ncbi:MAG: hypothetical protein ABIM99_05745 [Candidatus Dojkabacteria bacterium]
MNETPIAQLSLEERIKEFREKPYYDIRNGFPFLNSQEFFDVIFSQMTLEDNIFRMPITATEDPTEDPPEVHVYIQTNKIGGRLEHRAVVDLLHIDPKDIIYGSGLENITSVEPNEGMYITIPHIYEGQNNISYWVIKQYSDKYGKAITRDPKYVKQLKEIFEKVEGITFHNKGIR